MEEVCLAKFSPFLIEKIISTRITLKTVNLINGDLLVYVNSQREAESTLKMKTFHTTKCRAYPHEKLNTSKGVIRSRKLATEKEIASALGKREVMNIRKISIRKGEEQIQTYTYILTFNQPHIPKEMKISYCLERVEKDIVTPLWCFKCQKYGHQREACSGQQTCAKCSEKDSDHFEEDCLKQIGCVNCWQDHLAYVRSCDVNKKRKGNTWGEAEEKCVFSGNKENCRNIHERKQLHVCCTEGGFNQSR